MHKLITIAIMVALPAAGWAQGIQRGTLHGTALDAQGRPIGGVTLTVTAAELQGSRTTTTDESGVYSLPALPAGDYEIAFERTGFSPLAVKLAIPVGTPVVHDVVLQIAQRQETVVVTTTTPAPTSAHAAHFRRAEIEALAAPRTIQGIAQMAPSLTENSPSSNQLVINGGFGFDNIFMINGVDVNDNLRAQPQNLFIEDAVQETQVLTSGITADFGRFTGGVVNAITRSGGNQFSGSLRVNLFNPAWTTETPFETKNNVERLNKTQEFYEGTLGGPIVRNRVWFFGAGRWQESEASNTLPLTAVPYLQTVKNRRADTKVTGTPMPGSTLQGGYAVNHTNTDNGSGALPFIIDRHSLDTVTVPNWHAFTNYSAVLGASTLVDAQYTERRFTTGGGGTSTALVDSPFFSVRGLGPYVWNAPYFDRSDLEGRNNRQVTASVGRSFARAGRHDTKSGYEFFRSQRSGGGSQSSTGKVFYTDFATNANGTPRLDAAGRLIPVFIPGVSAIDDVRAQRGAVLNVDTQSAYVTDRWQIDGRWTASLGARFEHVRVAANGLTSISNNSLLPRLATAYDVRGNGQHLAQMTYGVYSGRYNEAQIGVGTSVVNASELVRYYTGPAGEGRDFQPAFDLVNYPIAPGNAEVQTAPPSNVSVSRDLKSPRVHEVTFAYGTEVRKTRLMATYIWRKTNNLIEDIQDTTTGATPVVIDGISAGVATNKVLENSSFARRDYQALMLESSRRLSSRLEVKGHYTAQLKNHGNYEGETSAVPGATSLIGNYPEAFNEARYFPYGKLQSFQRHRLRLWSIYSFPAGRLADGTVSGMWRVDSGRVYSLTTSVPLTATQISLLNQAGYPDRPAPGAVYFSGRGSESFKGSALFDASTSINFHLGSWRPWVKLDLFNVLNNQTLTSWNTAIRTDATSAKDSLGLPTGYLPGALFGQATAATQFAAPFNGATGGRTFRMSAGIRF